MGKVMSLASATAAVDYDATLTLAVDTSNKSWVVAAHVPGLGHIKAMQTTAPTADAFVHARAGAARPGDV